MTNEVLEETLETTETQDQQTSLVTTEQYELATVDSELLNTESRELLNKIIKESNTPKLNEYTQLFNINQNKKTLVRIDKMGKLNDIVLAQLMARAESRPDEITTIELVNIIKATQDMMERGQKQINGVNEAQPLIQINNQTNEVNLGDGRLDGVSRESRNNVQNAVSSLLQQLNNIKINQTPSSAPSNEVDDDIIQGEIVENE